MTRILYWNIQQFSSDNNVQTGGVRFTNRANFITNLVQVLGNAPNNRQPDIICIVEVKGDGGGDALPIPLNGAPLAGQLLNNPASIQAVTLLLAALRGVNPNWCLVPPLCSGQGGVREAVAVYYNSANLRFTGPHMWGVGQINGANINQSVPIPNPLVGQVPYPQWVQGFLNNTPNTVGALNENQLAACCTYYDINNAPVTFPNARNRTPYLTTFTEVNNGNANRNLEMYTIHTSPNTARPEMTRFIDFVCPPIAAPNSVNIVLGDFNVDTISDQQHGANGIYNQFIAGGYTVQLWPGNATDKRYCMTHLLSPANATPYIPVLANPATPQHNNYPRYGYMGSTTAGGGISDAGAIDNIITQYNGALVAPNNAATNMTIINPIVGSPYNIQPPLGVPASLTAGVVYPQHNAFAAPVLPLPTLPNPAGGHVDPGPPPPADPALTAFTGAFTPIHMLSDHLPLIIDI